MLGNKSDFPSHYEPGTEDRRARTGEPKLPPLRGPVRGPDILRSRTRRGAEDRKKNSIQGDDSRGRGAEDRMPNLIQGDYSKGRGAEDRMPNAIQGDHSRGRGAEDRMQSVIRGNDLRERGSGGELLPRRDNSRRRQDARQINTNDVPFSTGGELTSYFGVVGREGLRLVQSKEGGPLMNPHRLFSPDHGSGSTGTNLLRGGHRLSALSDEFSFVPFFGPSADDLARRPSDTSAFDGSFPMEPSTAPRPLSPSIKREASVELRRPRTC